MFREAARVYRFCGRRSHPASVRCASSRPASCRRSVPQHQQPSAIGSWLAALEQRLRELGLIKGRWAEGLPERSPGFVEFVCLKVDVIVAPVTAVAALK
jgi:hypothetical protein